MVDIVCLDWPAPKVVKACWTQRASGVSQAPFSSFNMGAHVGDKPEHVSANRDKLSQAIGQASIHWLEQVHGVRVVDVATNYTLQADASVCRQQNQVCCVMTADCLPVFFCDQQGSQVAIAHAGWRGLANGVIQQTLNTFADPTQVMAYLGPAISQAAFEVGDDVRDRFLSAGAHLTAHFLEGNSKGKWMADIYGLARSFLREARVTQIYGGDRCTYTEQSHFFSYRRDGVTGRMANLIWLES